MSNARDGSDNTSCVKIFSIESTMARGVVVSRSSPGRLLLSSGSKRSRRDTLSSSVRKNAVSAGGPPMPRSSMLAAALSLATTTAAASSRIVIDSAPEASFASTAGELTIRSALRDGERVIERERLAVHLPQQRGRERQLERGRHRVSRVLVDAETLAALRIEHVHAQAPADAFVDLRQRTPATRRGDAPGAREAAAVATSSSRRVSINPPPGPRSGRSRQSCVFRTFSGSRSRRSRGSCRRSIS